MLKNLPADAGGTGSSPELGRSHRPRSSGAHGPQPLSLHPRAREPQLQGLASPGALAPQQGVARTLCSWEGHAATKAGTVHGNSKNDSVALWHKGTVTLKGKEESVVSSKAGSPPE